MKKKLSRLLCALLVMTMVLAMVPAVSAAGSGSISDPYELYVGESMSFGCTEANHTSTAVYENVVEGVTTAANIAKSTYVEYSKTGRSILAKTTTQVVKGSGVIDGYVKVTLTCDKCPDASKTTTAYFRVYSKGQSLALKYASSSTVLKDSDTVFVKAGDSVTLDYSVLPSTKNTTFTAVTTANQKAVSVDQNTVATGLTVTANPNDQTITIAAAANADNYDGYFDLKYDDDSATVKTRRVKVVINGGTGVTITKDKTVVSGTTISASVGETLALTATGPSTSGTATWTVEDNNSPKVLNALGGGKFKVNAAGTAKITATINGVSASVTVSVINNVTSVAIEGSDDDNAKLIQDGEMNLGGTLTLHAKVKPSTVSDATKKAAVWSITSGESFVEFSKSNNDMWTIDTDANTATGEYVRLTAKSAGTFKIKVTLGGKSDELTMKINKQGSVIQIKQIYNNTLRATVRTGTVDEIVQQMNENDLYNSITAQATETVWGTEETYNVQVPVRWYDAQISSDKKTATVSGYAVTSREGDPNTYSYSANCNKNVTAKATLSDDVAITEIEVTSSKDLAIADDRVTLTANATVLPSNAKVSYQWYVNGKSVKDATNKTYTYTIPKASSDSSTSYKFKCEVTATYKGESTSTTSKEYTVTVSRDYAVSVSTSSGKTSFTVGSKPELEATLTYKGTKVSNPIVSWRIYDEKENAIDSAVATLSASGSTATLTTKAVKKASGDKIIVRATVSANNQSFSSTETLTITPVEASTVRQSVGSGAALKASSITSAITKAAGSNAKVSYLVFGTPKSCTLQKSSSSSTSIGDTKCYVSTTSGQKLSDVYVKTSASSASVTYTAYDADDYVLATGTVSFDANDTGDTITASGASLKTIGAIDQITGEYANADYVKFDLPRASEGKLYYDYTTISDFGGEVKDSDKYYLDASSSQNDLEDVYFLPAAGVTGKFKIDYTAYSSSNSDLGSGTITVNIKSKTASDKFTDVSTKTGFQWAADSIDFGADNGIIKGATTYTFAPSQSLTRAQLVTILYRAAGSPSVSGVTNPFKDTKSDYYTNAMLWAYKNSIVTGTSATTFSPDSPVTREQIAAILYRYMGSPTATGSLTGFTDRANVSAYATTAMQWAIGKGYITGIGTKLDPKGNATRAQVAVIIHRFLTK